ncbi:unnamed protein product [Amoebophrya sp. A25]|nr:unnamed protein product [Amoebophrya sp. A25]|eukprot:GSA25T00027541001.1
MAAFGKPTSGGSAPPRVAAFDTYRPNQQPKSHMLSDAERSSAKSDAEEVVRSIRDLETALKSLSGNSLRNLLCSVDGLTHLAHDLAPRKN